MVCKGDGMVCASEGMSYEVMVKGGKVMMGWFVKVKVLGECVKVNG